jgi:multiple sugar transport system substrate-binding protein
MKRMLMTALVVLLLVSSFAYAKEEIVLHQWDWISQPHQSAAFDDLHKAFQEKYPHIRIERTFYSFGDIRQQLLVGSIAGNTPDIVLVDNPDHQALAAAGVLADITEYVEEWGQADQFFDGPLASVVYNGRYYGLPQNSNTLALYYNKEMFAAAGIEQPPATWEELYEVAKRLTTPNVRGLHISANMTEEGAFQVLPFLWQAGADLDSLDSPEAIKAFSFIQKMVEDGIISLDVLGMDQHDIAMQFCSGAAAMMFNGPWNIATVRENADFEWGVALLPTDVRAASGLGGENWAIGAETEYVEEAFAFLAFASEYEKHRETISRQGRLPSRKDVAEDPVFTADELVKVFNEQLQYAKARAYGPHYPEMSRIFQEAYQAVMLGRDPEQVAKDTAAKMAQFFD